MTTTNRKYEFTGDPRKVAGVTVRRIRAVRDFGAVEAGQLGGWIENDHNLSHDGKSWVFDDACIYGNARVFGNACLYNYACLRDNALAYDDACVSDYACIWGNAVVCGAANVCGHSQAYGNARLSDNARLYDNARAYGNACLFSDARAYGNAHAYGNACIGGYALIGSNNDWCAFVGFGSVYRQTTAYRDSKLGICVTCGCFTGPLDKFRRAVIDTHGEQSKNGMLYLGIANIIEVRLGKGEQK